MTGCHGLNVATSDGACALLPAGFDVLPGAARLSVKSAPVSNWTPCDACDADNSWCQRQTEKLKRLLREQVDCTCRPASSEVAAAKAVAKWFLCLHKPRLSPKAEPVTAPAVGISGVSFLMHGKH